MSNKLSPALKPSTMEFVVKGITYICKTFKKRAPGTQSERDAQDYFAKELEPWSDEVKVEDFKLHPAAFEGFFSISAIFCIVGVVLFYCNRFGPSFKMTLVAAVLCVLAILMFFFEFLVYRKIVDFLFPKASSKNVYAVRKPVGEVKRRIIFGGHADAAWEWTYFLHGQMKAILPVMLGSIGGMFVALIFTCIYLANGTPPLTGGWFGISILLLALIPFFISIMFFVNWKVIVDGANDNLTACYASMSILKEMAENDFRFENTEVCCLITGSEEAGLRGAKAFCKKNAEELKKIETVFIPFEILRECEHLTIYRHDLNGLLRSDKAVVNLLLSVGEKLGIPIKCAAIPLGATDAAAFVQAGIHAAGLCGSKDSPQKYYHTRYDSYDNISPECIEKLLKLVMKQHIRLMQRV